MASWWKITFRGDGAEAASELAMELPGFQGSQILEENCIDSFFEGDEAILKRFAEEHSTIKNCSISIESVKDENWVAQSSDLLQSVRLGEFVVTPIISAEDLPKATAQDAIYIVPGMGFGTGHHPTTSMILRALSLPELKQLKPKRILDLGTGSGILAIGAAKLYDANIDAVDTDPLALENAGTNISLNPTEQPRIALKLGEISAVRGEYDLILANIYAEVLCSLDDEFFDRLRPGGLMIMSGIMENLLSAVLKKFSKPRWVELATKTESRWSMVILRKP